MKLLLLLSVSSLVIVINSVSLLLALLTALLLFLNFSSAKEKLKPRLKALIGISALIILFQLFFNSSLTLYQRLLQGFFVSLKILTLSLLVLTYTATTSVSQIIRHFGFLPQSFQLMFTITLSLIPAIFDEAKKISLIQASRGLHSTNPLPIIIPLLHRTLNRSQQLALTIETRGY